MKKVFELDFRGRKLTVEHGELAKQADGSVLVRYGDTVILSTVVVSDNANNIVHAVIFLILSFIVAPAYLLFLYYLFAPPNLFDKFATAL